MFALLLFAFSIAIDKAFSLISLATISVYFSTISFLSVIAIMPLPVHKSNILKESFFYFFIYSKTLYINSSVSIRGDKTSLVTLNFLS